LYLEEVVMFEMIRLGSNHRYRIRIALSALAVFLTLVAGRGLFAQTDPAVSQGR